MARVNDTEANEALWRAFGEWIEAQRRLTPYTQEAAAARAGMKRQQWSRIIKGVSGTKRTTVIRIAEAVGANVDEALVKAGYAPLNSDNGNGADAIPDAEIANFSSRVKRLTAQQKKDFKIAWAMANELLDRIERDKAESQ
jgi:transcriptional regulator with XRE-family HTH domain